MNDSEQLQMIRRGVPARIGICLLDLLHPGLGLVRLARYRAAGAFIVFNLASLAWIVMIYSSASPITLDL